MKCLFKPGDKVRAIWSIFLVDAAGAKIILMAQPAIRQLEEVIIIANVKDEQGAMWLCVMSDKDALGWATTAMFDEVNP